MDPIFVSSGATSTTTAAHRKRLRTRDEYHSVTASFTRQPLLSSRREVAVITSTTRSDSVVHTIASLLLGPCSGADKQTLDSSSSALMMAMLAELWWVLDGKTHHLSSARKLPAATSGKVSFGQGSPLATLCCLIESNWYDVSHVTSSSNTDLNRGVLQFLDDTVTCLVDGCASSVDPGTREKYHSALKEFHAIVQRCLPHVPFLFPSLRRECSVPLSGSGGTTDSPSTPVAAPGASSQASFPQKQQQGESVIMAASLSVSCATPQQYAVRCVSVRCMLSMESSARDYGCGWILHRQADRPVTEGVSDFAPSCWSRLEARVLGGDFYRCVGEFARDVDLFLAAQYEHALLRHDQEQQVLLQRKHVGTTANKPVTETNKTRTDAEAIAQLRMHWRHEIVDSEMYRFLGLPWPPSGDVTNNTSLLAFQWTPWSKWTPLKDDLSFDSSNHLDDDVADTEVAAKKAREVVRRLKVLDPRGHFSSPMWRLDALKEGVSSDWSTLNKLYCQQYSLRCDSLMTLDFAVHLAYRREPLRTIWSQRHQPFRSSVTCFEWLKCVLETIVDDCVTIYGPAHEKSQLASTLRSELVKSSMAVGLL